MNKIISLFFGTCLLVAGCNNSSSFRIEGEFTIKDPTPIELYLLEEESSKLVDSVNVAEEKFMLSGTIENPGIYQLRFFNDQSIYLVIFPGDKMKLRIDNKFPNISYYIENSFESKRVRELIVSQELTLRQIDQLSQEWELHRSDTIQRQKIDSAYLAIMRNQKKFTKEFIYAYPKSLANIMAIYQNFGIKSQPLFDPYDDFHLFRFVDSNLVSAYPMSAPVIALNKEVNAIKDEIKHKKFIKKVVETGRPLPLLRFPDINGDTLTIDDSFKKPVLIMFWASWSPYSVDEIIALNEYYQQPAAKNLQIVTISLDSSKEELLKFIAKHQLTVPVICDYNYWDSELVGRYAVKQVPSSFLSNKGGLIIARDIFGDELYNHINGMLK